MKSPSLTKRADQRHQSALVARLAQLKQWQAGRLQAAVALAELIERRQFEIENLERQLSKEISA